MSVIVNVILVSTVIEPLKASTVNGFAAPGFAITDVLFDIVL